MPVIDDRTALLDVPKPNEANNLRDDVERLRLAMETIANAIHANAQDLALRALLEHVHSIGQITGLADALDNKSDKTHQHKLNDLTDVDASDPANYQVVMRVGQAWQAATLVLAHINGWESTVDAKVAAANAALVGQAPATMDTIYEMAAALGNDPNFATTIATALGNRLRFDDAQARTETEQNQAIANLGGTVIGRQLLKAVDQAAARSAIGAVGLANPGAFTGTMTVPQPASDDNSLKPATTNWVRVLINAVNTAIGNLSTTVSNLNTALAGKFDKAGGTVTGQVTSASDVPTAFEATGAGPRFSWHIPGVVRKFLQAASTQLSLIDQGGTPHVSLLFDGRIWTSAYGYLDAKFYSTAADIAAVTGAAGGVGAYAFCTRTGGTVSHGQTVGGSTLVPAIGGTWRVMGQSVSNTVAGLFVRIS